MSPFVLIQGPLDQLFLNIINTIFHLAWGLSGLACWLSLASKLSIKVSLSSAIHASYLGTMSSFTGDPKPHDAFRGVSLKLKITTSTV